MTLTEIQLKLYENLKASGWGQKLKLFLLSDEFATILEELHKQSSEGKRFTPILKNVFRAFEECHYNELKIVMICQDPYPEIELSDGMLFSCSNKMKETSELRIIFNEIERTVYNPAEPREGNVIHRDTYNPDLTRWANQGILLLHMPLTCEIGKVESHKELWKPFYNFLFDMLNNYNTGIVYVYFGEKAKVWHKHISTQNYKFFSTHPYVANYRDDKRWDSGDLFNGINKIMLNLYDKKIKW